MGCSVEELLHVTLFCSQARRREEIKKIGKTEEKNIKKRKKGKKNLPHHPPEKTEQKKREEKNTKKVPLTTPTYRNEQQNLLGLFNISKSTASFCYLQILFSPALLVLDCEWLVYIHILMSFGHCGTYFSGICVSFWADGGLLFHMTSQFLTMHRSTLIFSLLFFSLARTKRLLAGIWDTALQCWDASIALSTHKCLERSRIQPIPRGKQSCGYFLLSRKYKSIFLGFFEVCFFF